MAGLKRLLSYIEEAVSNYPDYDKDQIIELVGGQASAPIDLVASAYDYVVQDHCSEPNIITVDSCTKVKDDL